MDKTLNQAVPLAESSGTGTYVNVRLSGPTLVGNNQYKFNCYFGTSSGSVFNNDGNLIQIRWSYDGGASVVGTSELKYIYGTLGSWSGTYTGTMPSDKIAVYYQLRTYDLAGDSRYAANTGWILARRGDWKMVLYSNSANSARVIYQYYNFHSEDLSYYNQNGGYTQRRHNTNTNWVEDAFDVALNVNSSYNMSYGQIPDGTTGPYQNGSKSITLATTFTDMSMPTVSAVRDPSDPTKVNVSWTAGGTTNKPSGGASRLPHLIARRTDTPGSAGNLAMTTNVNLESAGNYTFTGMPTNVEFDIFAEYSVTGLAGGTKYQPSNRVTFGNVFATRIKVNGKYVQASNGYIKVGGSYKNITAGYIKVNGVYKLIT